MAEQFREPLSAEACAERLDLTNDQTQALGAYLNLLVKWQRKINLVAQTTLDDPWRRHMLDSGQLLGHLPPEAVSIADLGSGAGFPGLVLAIISRRPVDLIEADQRKAAFLREAARLTGAEVTVRCQRIEQIDPGKGYDLITARALTSLERLLKLARPIGHERTVYLFPKGRQAESELTEAHRHWHMQVHRSPSLSDPEASVLRLTGVHPVG
ncbi:MAG: 16S rRNA (guanine(527)-N(7))-methyltransferase RsmG [Geminicoccaceae bacterium]